MRAWAVVLIALAAGCGSSAVSNFGAACDGGGQCSDDLVCGADTCTQSCSSTNQTCPAGYWCNFNVEFGSCYQQGLDHQTCAANNQCLSLNCTADGGQRGNCLPDAGP